MDFPINDIVFDWINQFEIQSPYNYYLRNLVLLTALALISLFSYLIAKKIILSILNKLAKKTKNNWDDQLVEKKVFHKLSHLVPAIVIYFLATIALEGYPFWIKITMAAATIYMIIIILSAISAFLKAVHGIYQEFPISKYKPIKGYLQVVKIIFYAIGIIVIFSILIGKSPAYLLGGLGALSAVLMLVFKDTLLGFVASIQLSTNDMARPGDWITMSKFGADGTVLEISLTTVKVQNFDKTITTIPTYAMISESFQNWRGMEESQGRRIKRSLNIDMNTVKFLSEEELKKLKKYRLLKDYIEKKQAEIDAFNEENNLEENMPGNSRRQTNIGVFRAYIEAYLKDNKNINTDLIFLIRQLQPGETGLPIEIYVFSKIQAWVEYEGIQADIFDHLIAVLPEFGLQLFQFPTEGKVAIAEKK
jgi:miniconductance mechanosensitive channel